MNRLFEFLEGDDGKFSSKNIAFLISLVVTSYIVLNRDSENLFSWYISAYSGVYIVGKGADAVRRLTKKQGKNDHSEGSL